MISEAQLDERLAAWSREYGWGGLPSGTRGKNILQKLIDHAGFVPERCDPPGANNLTWGDEVEREVARLQSSPPDPKLPGYNYRVASVLRVEYLTPQHWAIDERMGRLAAIGVSVSRTTYYEVLKTGRLYLKAVIAVKVAA